VVKRNGFVSLNLILLLVGLASFVGLIWGAYKLGGDHRAAEYEKVNAEERAARREMISGMALELAKRSGDLEAERLAHERTRRDTTKQREGVLHVYVPKTADSATCIRAGFVRYTNAAAAGVPLDARPGPGVAEAPAGVGTDTVAAVVGRNYDKYNDCKATVAGILKDFDTKRQVTNSVIDQINLRIKRAERKVQ
jgi:hypothetical protein